MLYMVRTQIQLGEEQARELKRLAHERGVSIAALVREGVDQVLGDRERERAWERAMSVAGKYRSGTGDLATEHDRHLDEIYGD